MKKILLGLCFVWGQLQAQESFQEYVQEVNSLTFYGFTAGEDPKGRYLNAPIVDLHNSAQQLVLEFDDLQAQYAQYKVRIVHCETDWTRSRLLDMEFMKDINELFVEDFNVSRNTKVPYYHYRMVLPKPILSGNYVLQLYRESDLIAQKRFWVYEKRVHVQAQVVDANDPELWRTHQQLNVNLDLGEYRIGIPRKELKIFIRMNQDQWKEVDNAHLASSGRNTFTLQQFSNRYLFPGQNEFRFLDISTTFSRGQNVEEIIREKPDVIFTRVQGGRGKSTYAESYDNDGGFIVHHLDQGEADFSADYAQVHFRLNAAGLPDGKIPVLLGRLTQGQEWVMEYQPESGYLEHTAMLKNGIYDFMFGLKDSASGEIDRSFFEGDFQQTKNTYEVFVYHAVPGRRHSSLIGYQIRK